MQRKSVRSLIKSFLGNLLSLVEFGVRHYGWNALSATHPWTYWPAKCVGSALSASSQSLGPAMKTGLVLSHSLRLAPSRADRIVNHPNTYFRIHSCAYPPFHTNVHPWNLSFESLSRWTLRFWRIWKALEMNSSGSREHTPAHTRAVHMQIANHWCLRAKLLSNRSHRKIFSNIIMSIFHTICVVLMMPDAYRWAPSAEFFTTHAAAS